jgi:hypothetical protein
MSAFHAASAIDARDAANRVTTIIADLDGRSNPTFIASVPRDAFDLRNGKPPKN